MEQTLKITPRSPPQRPTPPPGLTPRQETEWLTRGRFTGEPGVRAPEEGDRVESGVGGGRRPFHRTSIRLLLAA